MASTKLDYLMDAFQQYLGDRRTYKYARSLSDDEFSFLRHEFESRIPDHRGENFNLEPVMIRHVLTRFIEEIKEKNRLDPKKSSGLITVETVTIVDRFLLRLKRDNFDDWRTKNVDVLDGRPEPLDPTPDPAIPVVATDPNSGHTTRVPKPLFTATPPTSTGAPAVTPPPTDREVRESRERETVSERKSDNAIGLVALIAIALLLLIVGGFYWFSPWARRTTVDDLATRTGQIENQINNLSGAQLEVQASVTGLAGRVNTVETGLTELKTNVENVTKRVDTLNNTVTNVASRVQRLENNNNRGGANTCPHVMIDHLGRSIVKTIPYPCPAIRRR